MCNSSHLLGCHYYGISSSEGTEAVSGSWWMQLAEDPYLHIFTLQFLGVSTELYVFIFFIAIVS